MKCKDCMHYNIYFERCDKYRIIIPPYVSSDVYCYEAEPKRVRS